jgi:hypothetical protein
MLSRLFRRPSHGTVVAYLALFVALGGSAYAVNTVNSSDIVDGQVKSVDVGQNEIGSADVKDNSLNTFDVHSFLGVDVVDGSLTGADIGDATLTVQDIGDASFYELEIGSIPAANCRAFPVDLPTTFVGGQLLLSPSSAHPALVYTVRPGDAMDEAEIVVCNFAGATIDDGRTHFLITRLRLTPTS